MYRNIRTEVTHLPHCPQDVPWWPLLESLSELRPGAGGEDWGMEMGVDSGSKEKERLKYFIRELLLLSILVFEKFTLQTEECLVATIL